MSRPLNQNELTIFDTPAKGGSKYPWDLWTNGQAFAEKPAGKPESFRYLLRAQATKRGLTVEIRDLPDSGEIAFRFAKAEPETADAPAEPVTEPTTKAKATK
jgi:hypothetical protein